MLNEEVVINALKHVKYPGYSRDIVSFGLVKQVAAGNGAVSVLVQLTGGNSQIAQQIKADCENALKPLADVQRMSVEVKLPVGQPAAAGATAWANQTKVPGINRVVAVASGKGGVGKSTVSVNLACALKHLGAQVGLLDCDIYGPSIPLMMGINQKPTIGSDEKLVPPANHGVTIQQFVMQVDWGQLDYLLVDLPPGTGDAQLSLCQTVPLTGGVIVTTPQEAALGVVRKGIAMFQKVNVPILGLVENMSYFTAPNGERIEIFGHGGGQMEAERQNIHFLGEIPIYTEIRVGGDRGVPVVVSDPGAPYGQAFIRLAQALREGLE